MQSDVDWVGRDLQRLAGEKKLLRKPTEAEWKSIWRAATDWADAYGIVTNGVPIDEFVRKYAPGVLREPEAVPSASSSTDPQVPTAVVEAETKKAEGGTAEAKATSTSAKPESGARTRRTPRGDERPKAAGNPV